MDNKLVEFLNDGAIWLTPSRRLASHLLAEFNDFHAKHNKVWVTPRVYALEDWFHLLWEKFEINGKVSAQLLTQSQSLLRFEQIIKQSQNIKVLRTYETAKLCYEAWNLLHQYEGLGILTQVTDNIDHQSFQGWASQYSTWLLENNLIDNAQLPDHLLELLCHEQNAHSLNLYGFEELAPRLNQFFNVLKQRWEIHIHEVAPCTPTSMQRMTFTHRTQEYQAAALWAKELVSQHKNKIAIVVLDLPNERFHIEKIFKEVLDPLTSCQIIEEANSWLNISAALPLAQYPIIYAAIECLKLGTSNQLNDNIQSKFVNLKYAEIIKTISVYLKSYPEVLSYRDWATHFRNILGAIGWPGERSLTSVEHQLVKRFDEFLNEMSLCDVVLPKTNYLQAIMTVQKLASNMPFQAENRKASIQILGLLEAIGQHFEHLWVIGLHADAWPPMPKPNPFIPTLLQRQLKMPHASPEREMDYAVQVTDRLTKSAQEIIFSHCTKENDKTITISELIRHVPEKAPIDLNATLRIESMFNNIVTLENLTDNIAPPLSPQQAKSGFSSILSLQAACPFKAFAEIRLHAIEIKKEKFWLQPYQQGIILHEILQHFWEKTKSSNQLLVYSDDALEKFLKQLIDQCLLKYCNAPMPVHYLEVEKNRLFMILQDYISLEKSRTPFTVMGTEVKNRFELGGITFNLRFDRVDQSDGNYLLIDYKTGDLSAVQWWGERPLDPQLPLYFLTTAQHHPQALVVIKLRSEGCEYLGHSAVEMGMPFTNKDKIPQTWEDLNEYWTQTLGSLATAFYYGQATVDPVDGAQTCEYCHVGPLCRIQEVSQ